MYIPLHHKVKSSEYDKMSVFRGWHFVCFMIVVLGLRVNLSGVEELYR